MAIFYAATLLSAIALAQQPPAPKQPADKPPGEETDPAVAALLASKPTTPTECVRAAKVLHELERDDLAKGFLKKALDAKLDQGQLAELGRQVGEPLLMELADIEALKPEARTLADAVAAALRAAAHNPQRIAALLDQLTDPAERKRIEAVAGLQEAGDAAVLAMLAALVDPARERALPNIRAALAGMGRSARGPLLAVLEGDNKRLSAEAIAVLGMMNDRRMSLYLLAPALADDSPAEVRAAAVVALGQLLGEVPQRFAAARLLYDSALAYFDRREPIAGAVDGRAAWWLWDATAKQPVEKTLSEREISRLLAARLAHDAYQLAADEEKVRLLHLTAMLDAAAHANGLDRPLDDKSPAISEAAKQGPKIIEEVLQLAMQKEHPAAAAAAARLLGRIGTADELLYRGHEAAGSQPSPLVLAAQYPDHRVRLAAAEAIIGLKPTKPFAGASYVTDALAFLAGSRGIRGSVVACPNSEHARDLAGRLAAAGYRTETCSIGREALLRAADSPDCELVFIDMTIDRPTADALVQQLRHDPRTAAMRVGLIAGDGRLEAAERIVRGDPLAAAFARPHDDKAFAWQLERLAELSPEGAVSLAQRQRHSARALELLTELGKMPRAIFDLRRSQPAALAALGNPDEYVASRAVAFLAGLNSADAQRALAELSGNDAKPAALRMSAAGAFARNVEKHGILLSTAEIRRQYDRFNAADKQDTDSRRALGLILDALEAAGPARK
jgi:CheY-like chemotaxis protein